MPLNVSDAEKAELFTTYAALILHDDKAPITAENITTIITAAGGVVEPYWPKLFASLLEGADVASLLNNSGGAAAAPAAAAGPAAVVVAAPQKKKEKTEESEADMGFSLFD